MRIDSWLVGGGKDIIVVFERSQEKGSLLVGKPVGYSLMTLDEDVETLLCTAYPLA
jgi:hypothetical protein